MAVSAFKSTSRRATSATASNTPPLPASSSGGSGKAAEASRRGRDAVKKTVPATPRRSRSVSAFSRTSLGVDSDFANKRDNPLYWSADVDSPRLDGGGLVKVAKFHGAVSGLSDGSSKVSGGGGGAGGSGSTGGSRRGRAVTRYSEPVREKSTVSGDGSGCERVGGRSLSRIDTGRRRSVSRGHYGNSEGEGVRVSTALRSRSKTDSNVIRVSKEDKSGVHRSDSDLSELLKTWQSWSNQQDISGVSQCGDGGSMSSLSDAEEVIKKPASGRMNVMRRSSSTSTLGTEITDAPLELANSAEAELVLEARGEYARKLEEAQERARKLRAELAVEEHRKVELNKILDEMIVHPETPDVKKPRAVRKASMERRKVSRRLEEEALAYFDECVSISTFDESDFSSLEDPLSNIVGSAEQRGKRTNLPSVNASVSVNTCPVQNPDHSNPTSVKYPTSHSTSNSASPESPSSRNHISSKKAWKRQFSFADKQKDSSTLTQELRTYAKIFTKDGVGKESSDSQSVNRNHHYTDEYGFSVPTEKFLFERVASKYRIDSGGMLLCGGATGFPFSNVM